MNLRIPAPKREEQPTVQRPTQVAEDVRLQSLIDKLVSWRIKPIERPVYEDGEDINPVLPQDLTRITDQALGALYTEFSAMVVWTGYRHGLAAVLRAKLEAEKERTFSRLFLMQSGNREEKKAKADTHPTMIEVEDDFLLAQSMETLLYPILQGYVTGKESTSREITRRQGAEWGDRRGMGNMPQSRVPYQPGR